MLQHTETKCHYRSIYLQYRPLRAKKAVETSARMRSKWPIVTTTRHSDHSTLILANLYWLPVKYQNKYNTKSQLLFKGPVHAKTELSD